MSETEAFFREWWASLPEDVDPDFDRRNESDLRFAIESRGDYQRDERRSRLIGSSRSGVLYGPPKLALRSSPRHAYAERRRHGVHDVREESA